MCRRVRWLLTPHDKATRSHVGVVGRHIPLGQPDEPATVADVYDAAALTLQLRPNHLPRHMYNLLRLALGLSSLEFDAVEPLLAAAAGAGGGEIWPSPVFATGDLGYY